MVEGGGELIGSNHPTWVSYAKKFGLSFNDVTESETLEAPVIIGGKRLTEKESEALWEEMEAAYKTDERRRARRSTPTSRGTARMRNGSTRALSRSGFAG